MAKKKPTKKKAAKNTAPKKKAVKKKAAKKAAPRVADRGLIRYGRPVCRTIHGYLGNCMLWANADVIARRHEANFPNCAVDIENC